MGFGSSHFHPARLHSGFTLVELTLVIVLLGIVSVLVAPRFFDLSVFQARGYYDEALAATRFAHKYAIATGCNARIQFSAGGYAVTRADTCQGLAFGPGVPNPSTGASFGNAPPSGIVVSDADVYFDGAGRPRDPASGALLTAPTNVSIDSRTLRIEAESGYAHSP